MASSLNDLSNGEKMIFVPEFQAFRYSKLLGERGRLFENSGSIPSCRDRFATGGKAEMQNVPNAKLIGASRRGVRPHRGGRARVILIRIRGVSAGTVFGVQCPPDGQRGSARLVPVQMSPRA